MCRNIRIKFLSWAYMSTTLRFLGKRRIQTNPSKRRDKNDPYGSSRQSYTCCMRAASDLAMPYLLLQIGCQAVPGNPFRMHVHPQRGQRRHQDRKSPRESSPPIRGFLLRRLIFSLLPLLDDNVCGQDLMAGGGPSVCVWPGQRVSRQLQGHATFRSEEAESE